MFKMTNHNFVYFWKLWGKFKYIKILEIMGKIKYIKICSYTELTNSH